MLKSFAIAVFAVVFCVQIGYAQSGWEKVAGKGEFEAMFPGKAEFAEELLDPADASSKQHSYSYASDAGYYTVTLSWIDEVPDPIIILDAGIEGLLANGGKLISKTPSNLGKYKALNFKVAETKDGRKIVYAGKLVLAGKSFYTVMAVTAEEGAASPDVQEFLSSFRVIK